MTLRLVRLQNWVVIGLAWFYLACIPVGIAMACRWCLLLRGQNFQNDTLKTQEKQQPFKKWLLICYLVIFSTSPFTKCLKEEPLA